MRDAARSTARGTKHLVSVINGQRSEVELSMNGNTQALIERAERVIDAARGRGVTIATAEYCTAGALAHLLANAPGAGEVFHCGFIVYTKEQKSAALAVSPELIAEHTAVSAAVAQAMAEGALQRSSADLAVSITGVLGPEPDEDGNPVGLIYIGLAKRDGFRQTDEAHLDNKGKDEICATILERALILLEAGISTGESEAGAPSLSSAESSAPQVGCGERLAKHRAPSHIRWRILINKSGDQGGHCSRRRSEGR
jgi:nicotinamide-nucleotide amidase